MVVLLCVVRGIRNDISRAEEKKRKQDEQVSQQLARFKKLLRENNIMFYTEILPGDPRDVILSSAKKNSVDYIAMGSRGLSGIKSFVLGANSSYVVEQSPIPVFVVK